MHFILFNVILVQYRMTNDTDVHITPTIRARQAYINLMSTIGQLYNDLRTIQYTLYLL